MSRVIAILLVLIPSVISGQPPPGDIYTLQCLTEYPEMRDEFRAVGRMVMRVGPNYRYRKEGGIWRVYYPDRGWRVVCLN